MASTKQIVSPEGRYWEGAGPEGQDVVMITGKHYPDSLLRPDFLERCLEDGLVTYVEQAKPATVKPAPQSEEKE